MPFEDLLKSILTDDDKIGLGNADCNWQEILKERAHLHSEFLRCLFKHHCNCTEKSFIFKCNCFAESLNVTPVDSLNASDENARMLSISHFGLSSEFCTPQDHVPFKSLEHNATSDIAASLGIKDNTSTVWTTALETPNAGYTKSGDNGNSSFSSSASLNSTTGSAVLKKSKKYKSLARTLFSPHSDTSDESIITCKATRNLNLNNVSTQMFEVNDSKTKAENAASLVSADVDCCINTVTSTLCANQNLLPKTSTPKLSYDIKNIEDCKNSPIIANIISKEYKNDFQNSLESCDGKSKLVSGLLNKICFANKFVSNKKFIYPRDNETYSHEINLEFKKSFSKNSDEPLYIIKEKHDAFSTQDSHADFAQFCKQKSFCSMMHTNSDTSVTPNNSLNCINTIMSKANDRRKNKATIQDNLSSKKLQSNNNESLSLNDTLNEISLNEIGKIVDRCVKDSEGSQGIAAPLLDNKIYKKQDATNNKITMNTNCTFSSFSCFGNKIETNENNLEASEKILNNKGLQKNFCGKKSNMDTLLEEKADVNECDDVIEKNDSCKTSLSNEIDNILDYDLRLCSNDFKTASGNKVKIEEKSLVKVKCHLKDGAFENLCTDFDSDMGNNIKCKTLSTNIDCSISPKLCNKKNAPTFIENNCSIQIRDKESNNINSASISSFQTGFGNIINIDKSALNTAKKLLDDNSNCDNQSSIYLSSSNKAFKTGNCVKKYNNSINNYDKPAEGMCLNLTGLCIGSANVSVNELAPKNVKKLLDETSKGENLYEVYKISSQTNNIATTVSGTQKIPLKFTGFQTGLGSVLHISESAFNNEIKLFDKIDCFDTIDSSCTLQNLRHDTYTAENLNEIPKMSSLHNNMSVSVYKTEKKSLKLTGFQTGLGSIVNVSESALKNAKKLLDESDCSNTVSYFASDLDNLQNLLQNKHTGMKLHEISKLDSSSNNISYTVPENMNRPLKLTGFKTALGSVVSVNEFALRNVRELLNESNCTDSVASISTSQSLQHHNCTGENLFVSKIRNPSNIISDVAPETEKRPLKFIGFQTGLGNIINVSESALKNSKKLLDESDYFDAVDSTGITQIAQHCNHTDKDLFEASKISNLLYDISAPASEADKRLLKFTGFQTGLGSVVNVSETALKNAKELLNERDCFDTVGSLENLQQSNPCTNLSGNSKLNSLSNTSAPVPNTGKIPLIFTGFQTGLGSVVNVCESALKNAKELLNENDAVSSLDNMQTLPQNGKIFDSEFCVPQKKSNSLKSSDLQFAEHLDNVKSSNGFVDVNIFETNTFVSKRTKSNNLKCSYDSDSFDSMVPDTLTIKNGNAVKLDCGKWNNSDNICNNNIEFKDNKDEISVGLQINNTNNGCFLSKNKPIQNKVSDSEEILNVTEAFLKDECGFENNNNIISIFGKRPAESYNKDFGSKKQKTVDMLMEVKLEREIARLKQKKIMIKKSLQPLSTSEKGHYIKLKSTSAQIKLSSLKFMKGSEDFCLEAKVKINPENALQFRFPLNDDRLITVSCPDNCFVIPGDDGCIGVEEIEKGFYTAPFIKPSLIPCGWIANHFKWIIWKLSSMQVELGESFSENVSNVISQLRYRYDREIIDAHRSIIRKIIEQDCAPQEPMVLCISRITNLQPSAEKEAKSSGMSNNVLLELTDGWYAINTVFDTAMMRLIESQKLKVGFKILIEGAEFTSHTEPCHPLETSSAVALRIHTNMSRRVKWFTKLGRIPYSHCPRNIPLLNILEDGGCISSILVKVVRVYPLQFLEKIDGQNIIRSETEHLRKLKELECKKELEIQKVFQEVESKFEACEDKLADVDDRVAEILKKLPLDAGDLSMAETQIMQSWFAKKEEQKQIAVNKELQKRMNILNNYKPVSMLKLIVFDKFGSSAGLLVWHTSEDLIQTVKEGRVFTIHKIAASGKRDGLLQLVSTKQTVWETIENESDFQFEDFDRQIVNVSLLNSPSFQPLFSEVDIVGMLIQIGGWTGNYKLVYFVDSENSLFALKLWNGIEGNCYDHILKLGNVLCIINGRWKGKGSGIMPFIYVTSQTLLTLSPKFADLKKYLKKFSTTNCEKIIAGGIEKLNGIVDLDLKPSLCNTNFESTLSSNLHYKGTARSLEIKCKIDNLERNYPSTDEVIPLRTPSNSNANKPYHLPLKKL